jgi:hypothetical protein
MRITEQLNKKRITVDIHSIINYMIIRMLMISVSGKFLLESESFNNVPITNFLFICSNIPEALTYGVYILSVVFWYLFFI